MESQSRRGVTTRRQAVATCCGLIA
jgi:hypothetical protein